MLRHRSSYKGGKIRFGGAMENYGAIITANSVDPDQGLCWKNYRIVLR